MDDELFFQFGDDPEIGLDDNSAPRSRRVPEKHLSSPICIGLLERIRDFCESVPDETVIAAQARLVAEYGEDPLIFYSGLRPILNDYFSALSKIRRTTEKISLLDPREYPELFRINFPREGIRNLSLETHLADARAIYTNSLEAFTDYIKDVCRPAEVNRIREKLLSKYRISSRTKTAFTSSRLYHEIVDAHRMAMYRQRYGKIINIGQLRCAFFDGFARLEWNNKVRYCVYEQLQMLQDALQARFNVYLACDMQMTAADNNLGDKVESMLTWHSTCLAAYGNDGYELVKAPEALFKTYLTKMTKGELLEYGSYERTLLKIRQKEWKLAKGHSPRIDALDAFIHTITDIQSAVELFGLIKLSGHPVVYAKYSAKSARDEALTVDKSVPLALHTAERIFKHIIISSHLSKFTEWPAFQRPPRSGTRLYEHWRRRVTSLPLDSYSLSDLDYIELGQLLNFDYSTDYLKFIDDKAINPGASEASSFWFSTGDRSNRRLITKILSDPDFDMKAIADRIAAGKFREDEFYIELTQKERELKKAARCFCKLPIEVRFFFTLNEMNLAKMMEIYFPQQTMTMSDAETKKRLYQMACGSTKRNRAIGEFDFSRWNLNFREDFEYVIGRQIDHMHGTHGMFIRGHDYFSRSTICVTDRHYLPDGVKPGVNARDWPRSSLVWGPDRSGNGPRHYGGFEGIRQKMWTILTILICYMSLLRFPVSFIMAGQGDNQVLVITSLDGTKIGDMLPRVLAEFEYRALMVNQVVKPDECLDSATVLTYSKEIYVSGVHYPYALKFLSRTFAHSDGDIPMLSSELASIASSSLAAACCLPLPVRGREWCVIQTLLALEELSLSALNSDYAHVLARLRNNGHVLKFALELPASLGGFPIPSWGHFLIRGEMDPLTWDIASILRLPRAPRIRRDLRRLLDGQLMSHSPDLTQLVLDPFSLPLARPRDSTRIIRDALDDTLFSVTKNRTIKPLLSTGMSRSGDELLKILATWRPLYPHILADLYGASPAGLRDDLFGRFTYTRTLQTLTDIGRFSHSVQVANIALVDYITARYNATEGIRIRNADLVVQASGEYARKLRAYWLDEESTGTITIDCPLAMRLTTDIVNRSVISAHIRTPMNAITSTVGKYPPNFGTTTKQKRSEHGFKIITSSDSLLKIKMLVAMSTQVELDENCTRLIDNLISSRSPWKLKELRNVFPTAFGGVGAHRHDSMTHKFYGIMGSCTVPTHIHLSSDRSGKLAGGTFDYSFIFQEPYLLLTSMFQHLSNLSVCSTKAIAVDVDSINLVPLPNNRISSISDKLPTWPDLRGNPLSYVDSLQFARVSSAPSCEIIPRDVGRSTPLRTLVSVNLNNYRVHSQTSQTLRFLVSGPSDPMDLAEFMHVNPFTICKSIALSSLLAYGRPRNMSDVYATINRQTHTLARLFMTPDGQSLRFSQDSSLFFHPSEPSPLSIASRLSTTTINIYHSSTDPIKTLRETTPVTICADYPSSGLQLVYVVCSWMIRHLHLGAEISPALNTLRHIRDTPGYHPLQRVYAIISYLKECVDYTSADDTQHRQQAFALACAAKWPLFLYSTADTSEYRRRLRVMRDLRPKCAARPFRIRRSRSLGRVLFKRDPGTIHTKIEQPHMRSLEDRLTQLLVDRATRRCGVSTTALSVWLPYLEELSRTRLVSLSSTLVIGTGSGAISAAIGLLGGHSTGVDRIGLLPVITQRETSLVPPEVGIQGVADTFSWHDTTFSTAEWDSTLSRELVAGRSLVIIDIEQISLPIVQLMMSERDIALIIRTFLSLPSIESLNSFLPGLHYHVPSNYRRAESVPVLILRPSGVNIHPGEPTEINRIEPWLPECSDDDILVRRLDYIISRQGLTVRGTELATLRKYTDSLPVGSFAHSAIRNAIEVRERPHVDIIRRAFNSGSQAIRELTYLPSPQLEALISIYLEEGRQE